MLLDSAHIQENDVAYVNRSRQKQGRRPFEPLYTRRDATATLTQFVSVEYDRLFEPLPGVQVHFRDAGHMLGSAIVVLDLEEAGRRRRLVFSGDVGRKGLPILRDPQVAEHAHELILESTYGDRLHESRDAAKELLLETTRQTCQRGGKLLIPAFAVGRTQDVAYRLNQLWEEGALPNMDVYVDSPLAVDVTEVFRLHPECFDREMIETQFNDTDRDPFGFKRLRYLRDVEASKALNHREEPAIIISASGMCEAGRILHHLRNHIDDPRTTVLFVGFQAEHTLGRKLLDGQNPVPILGGSYRVRATIQRADGYSAHADRAELLHWAKQVQSQGNLQRAFLVHGEEPSAFALAEGLRAQGLAHVEVPTRGQVFEL